MRSSAENPKPHEMYYLCTTTHKTISMRVNSLYTTTNVISTKNPIQIFLGKYALLNVLNIIQVLVNLYNGNEKGTQMPKFRILSVSTSLTQKKKASPQDTSKF